MLTEYMFRLWSRHHQLFEINNCGVIVFHIFILIHFAAFLCSVARVCYLSTYASTMFAVWNALNDWKTRSHIIPHYRACVKLISIWNVDSAIAELTVSHINPSTTCLFKTRDSSRLLGKRAVVPLEWKFSVYEIVSLVFNVFNSINSWFVNAKSWWAKNWSVENFVRCEDCVLFRDKLRLSNWNFKRDLFWGSRPY